MTHTFPLTMAPSARYVQTASRALRGLDRFVSGIRSPSGLHHHWHMQSASSRGGQGAGRPPQAVQYALPRIHFAWHAMHEAVSQPLCATGKTAAQPGGLQMCAWPPMAAVVSVRLSVGCCASATTPNRILGTFRRHSHVPAYTVFPAETQPAARPKRESCQPQGRERRARHSTGQAGVW